MGSPAVRGLATLGLLAATGDVLEVAVGTGLNLPAYPATVPLGGEHFLRRPMEQVRAAGFDVERAERFKAGIVERLTARKPAQP